ncbi:RNA-directed DNA polymerase, eukaryota [Tanacetum coccineum]
MAVKNKNRLMLVIRRFLRTQPHKGIKFKDTMVQKNSTPNLESFPKGISQLQISKVLKRRPGKHPDIAKKNPKPNREIELNWSKRSIFWDLEYWPFLKLKHNLDVMHIEKNALEALLNTLLQNDKTKDTVKAKSRPGNLKVRTGVVKVVEHVYHRDVAESDQDVIHGSNSSNVTLSVELTNFGHTDLGINSESTEVDAPPVNDDNANANEGNAEDDDVAHVLDDDDDVVVSDDDEVNPSTNVEEMACVYPRSHGGDAGGTPPRRPNRPVPAQCESSNQRIETGNASLRRAFRQNGQRPLTIGFDYGDLGTFHPTGDYSSMLNSLMGETVKYLPLACEWEEIPEAYKAHIFPTLESYFDLASWYNNQDKVVMGHNVYTVGDRIKLGLQLKLRILWPKNKQRIKADHFTRYGSAEEASNHLPLKKVWGDRTEDEWNNLVDCPKGHDEDLIETWRKTHSRAGDLGSFKTQKNLKRYLDKKSMQEQLESRRDGEFKVKAVRNYLDDLLLPSQNAPTRWVKCIPIKVNVFAWRARRDRLPTRLNLSRRGVAVDSSLCPLCDIAVEDNHHVFFCCNLAKSVIRKICLWWDLDSHVFSSFSDWDGWFLSIRMSSSIKSILEGVFCVAWWRLWMFRNQLIFYASPPRRSVVFDDIASQITAGQSGCDTQPNVP